jgi:hypothetical protein
MPETTPPRTAAEETKWQNKKLAYHEAAHAVLFWNLGFGVEQVWIDRIRHCGHARAAQERPDRTSRIGYAVASVAGLAAQIYLEPEPTWQDTVRSFQDFRLALIDFLPPVPHTDGEQLGVALVLTKQTRVLLAVPELKKQIQSLVPPLLLRGCLLQREVNVILKGLPESPIARQKCKEFVTWLEQQREALIASQKGYAPEFSWDESTRIKRVAASGEMCG